MAALDDPGNSPPKVPLPVEAAALPARLALEFVRQAPFLPRAAVSCATVSSAVQPWPHQSEVVRRATLRYPQGFLFCDEVGLGKTIEAGLALRSLWIARGVRRALILVPAALLRQWQEEMHEKFALEVARLDGDRFFDVRGREIRPDRSVDNPWNRHDLVLASSQLVRRRERGAELLAAEPWDLVIVDEAHHARRRDPATEGFRPNRLLGLLGALAHRSRCLWLLTATPMQLHPLELWDLLSLVGAPAPTATSGPPAPSAGKPEQPPWRAQVFRHTRKVLRRYQSLGLLDAAVPVRRPENVWIELGDEAGAVYRRIESYLSLFYRRYEAERRGLGFVMTVYRRRLTSSFAAIRCSLMRRRERLASGVKDPEASGPGDSGPGDSPGLFDAASGADEQEHLDGFLQQLTRLGADPKVERLRTDLRQLLRERDRVLVFTGYLDTLDHLRDVLSSEWHVACWSGRGGEVSGIEVGGWVGTGKEDLKAAFLDGEIQVLLATDAAGEGLNLQSCGVLINFDMPWNPMRVEQRIGRIDRIGQRHPEVWIRNYFYAETVEAEIYRRLMGRIRWFEDVVGAMQPILRQVGEAVGELAMLPPERRRRPLEEKLRALERSTDERASQETVDLLEELAPSPTVVPPVTPRQIERLVVETAEPGLLNPDPDTEGIFRLRLSGEVHRVTFLPEIYDAHPESTRLLTWGVPHFDRLLDELAAGHEDDPKGGWSMDEPGGVGIYRSERPAPVTLFLHPAGEAASLADLRTLAASAPTAWRPDEEAEVASRFSGLRRRALRVREDIEAERRRAERGELHGNAIAVLAQLALLELVAAENPGLFDQPLAWSFGRRAVRELARHGSPLSDLVERLDAQGLLPSAERGEAFYAEARDHRHGWRERRRRVLVQQAEECHRRACALDAAEAEAQLRQVEASAGMLSRRWYRLAAPAPETQLLDAADAEPFVDVVPALGTLEVATSRLLDAAEEGWDLLQHIRRHPGHESWLHAPGRSGPARFAAQVIDDDMAPKAPAGAWALFETEAGRAVRNGTVYLLRHGGRTLLRRIEARGDSLVLDADAAVATVVVDDADPESMQVVARFVGLIP